MESRQPDQLARVLDEVAAVAKALVLVSEQHEARELAVAVNVIAIAAAASLSVVDQTDYSIYLEKAQAARKLLLKNVAAGGRDADSMRQAVQLVVQLSPAEAAESVSVSVTAGPIGSTAVVATSDEQLLSTASSFRHDARRAARIMMGLYLVVLALIALATVMLWLLVFVEDPRPAAPDFVAQSLPSFALMAIATLLAQQANRQRRNAEELKRVELQMRALPVYLTPLPEPARHLLRSVMLQRLFPRLLEDDDPLRESDWFPSEDYLVITLNEEHAPEILEELHRK